jgi:crotonobetainyl-CoA:carnitine CoA-transferase CaiB-like acyl-CoA transferase
MQQPFAGVRVLDATHVLAGPYATYLLAVLGADVIRVESPTNFDFVRYRGSVPELNRLGLAPNFLIQNSNKRSISINLKAERGQSLFKDLIAQSDVLVENFRPGVLARWSLDAEHLQQVNPMLIYCSITGYGQRGPWRDDPAYDHVVQALSGMMSANALDSGRPRRVGFPVIDYITGLSASFAIASALFQRTHTGEGQIIDVTMLESALTVMSPLLGQALMGGGIVPRVGDRAASGSPFSGMFETKDGYIALAANTIEQGRRVALALNMAHIADDPRMEQFNNNPAFADEVEALLAKALTARSAKQWAAIFVEHDVPSTEVRSVDEVIEEEHLVNRPFLHPIPIPDAITKLGADLDEHTGQRRFEAPGPGFKLAGGDARLVSPPPRQGEHSREILAELGLAESELDQLERDGVIAGPPAI